MIFTICYKKKFCSLVFYEKFISLNDEIIFLRIVVSIKNDGKERFNLCFISIIWKMWVIMNKNLFKMAFCTIKYFHKIYKNFS